MPPKQKKIDPELQKAQFEEWKEKDEYRIWSELQIISKSLDSNISETTFDLTGNWQIYHDKLMELCQVFKCKTKLKMIEHIHIRSAFFAVEDIEINKVIQKQYIDGFYYSVEKQDKDRGTHVKQAFAKIARTLEDHKFFDMNAESYMADRKNLVTLLNEFLKKLPILIKLSHKIIEVKLFEVLAPLNRLLEINKKMMFFDLRNIDQRSRLVRDFMLKADINEYCLALQDCQRILTDSKSIPANPNVKLIFNKLAYEGWHKNKVESFYLLPLQNCFDQMRNNLLCLMIKGINFYKTPLNANTQFVSDLIEVINAELIAEHLMGNLLKKDQLNFVFIVLSVIFNANTQSKEFLLKKDENCILGSVPKLVAYHTVLHMRHWKDMKIQDEAKQQKQLNKTKGKEQEQVQEEKEPSQLGLSAYMSPEKKKQAEEEQKKKDELLKQASEAEKLQLQQDTEKYGRYWLWDNYCSEEHKEIFEECSELIRHVNLAVQQDIEDEIIKEGMIPKHRQRKAQENDPSQMFNELRKRDNANTYTINRRPPELWNYPKVIEEKHEFRAIADPKKCYIDGRIEAIEQKIIELGNHLMQNKPIIWNELINRVIDALQETYNAQPTVMDIVIQL